MIADLATYPPDQSDPSQFSGAQPITACPCAEQADSPSEDRCAPVSLPSVTSLQPIQNVCAYLHTRRPVLHPHDERCLFITLPEELRDEIEALLAAFDLVEMFLRAGLSVHESCRKVIASLPLCAFALRTFRAKFDKYSLAKDWLILVNRSKAGAAWQDNHAAGLPSAFLEKVIAPAFARYRRADGKRQAIMAVKRWWTTGRDLDGHARPMPGYEGTPASAGSWSRRNPELFPPGWHYSNLLRQIKQRALFTHGVRALLHDGTAAAKEHLPQVLGTRAHLRFLERVTFDDVRTDWLVFDPETGQPCELWLLLARDHATAMILGFVMHLSQPRDDGSASHLGLQEMKQLAGFILERYPLPVSYLCTWVVERGTATLSEGSARALQELLPTRIKISYTSMIGGNSPVGYKEKAKGNSRGKASHESHNRLLHTQGCVLPGQTGARYDIRPADLNARARECVEVWELRNRLPAHLRGQEQYTLLTPGQARQQLIKICLEQNFRADHALEAFEEVLEWLGPDGQWQPQTSFSPAAPKSDEGGSSSSSPKFRKRMERPVERALRLMAGHKFESVSPDIIRAFYFHTERLVPLEPSGEIHFKLHGNKVAFSPPPGFSLSTLNSKSTKVLAYFHPDDPKYLHVTNAKGSLLGTWLRRNRAANQDDLAEAFRYTGAALKAARAQAAQLATEERDQIAAIRQHNSALEKSATDFIEIASPQLSTANTLTSPIASGLAGVATARAQSKAADKQRQADDADARETFRKSADVY